MQGTKQFHHEPFKCGIKKLVHYHHHREFNSQSARHANNELEISHFSKGCGQSSTCEFHYNVLLHGSREMFLLNAQIIIITGLLSQLTARDLQLQPKLLGLACSFHVASERIRNFTQIIKLIDFIMDKRYEG